MPELIYAPINHNNEGLAELRAILMDLIIILILSFIGVIVLRALWIDRRGGDDQFRAVDDLLTRESPLRGYKYFEVPACDVKILSLFDVGNQVNSYGMNALLVTYVKSTKLRVDNYSVLVYDQTSKKGASRIASKPLLGSRESLEFIIRSVNTIKIGLIESDEEADFILVRD